MSSQENNSQDKKGENGKNYLKEETDVGFTQLSEEAQKLITSIEKFGYSLFLQLAKDKNQIISPYSIFVALCMTADGANGITKEGIRKTLNVNRIEEAHMQKLHKDLMSLLNVKQSDNLILIANSIWLNDSINYYDSFVQHIKGTYDAEVKSLASTEAINEWVATNTNGRIIEMVEDIDPNTVMILLNAIYFLGSWTEPFDDLFTKEQEFFNTIDSSTPVAFMEKSSLFSFVSNKDYQLIRLPYGVGKYYLEIVLPSEENNVEKITKALKAGSIMLEEPDQKKFGTIIMPKFSVESDLNLNEILKLLGMEDAFNDKNADFSKIASVPPKIFINKVKHKSFLEVNETSTEAIAATSVELTRGTAQDEEFEMLLNRPFLFQIKENKTGLLLFLGRVENLS